MSPSIPGIEIYVLYFEQIGRGHFQYTELIGWLIPQECTHALAQKVLPMCPQLREEWDQLGQGANQLGGLTLSVESAQSFALGTVCTSALADLCNEEEHSAQNWARCCVPTNDQHATQLFFALESKAQDEAWTQCLQNAEIQLSHCCQMLHALCPKQISQKLEGSFTWAGKEPINWMGLFPPIKAKILSDKMALEWACAQKRALHKPPRL